MSWTLVDLRLKDDLIKNAVSGLRMMKYNSIKNDFNLEEFITII